MTRRDFAGIAAIIAATRDSQIAQGFPVDAIDLIASNLAETFKLSNPRFNRERFLKACNVPESQEDSDETS